MIVSWWRECFKSFFSAVHWCTMIDLPHQKYIVWNSHFIYLVGRLPVEDITYSRFCSQWFGMKDLYYYLSIYIGIQSTLCNFPIQNIPAFFWPVVAYQSILFKNSLGEMDHTNIPDYKVSICISMCTIVLLVEPFCRRMRSWVFFLPDMIRVFQDGHSCSYCPFMLNCGLNCL